MRAVPRIPAAFGGDFSQIFEISGVARNLLFLRFESRSWKSKTETIDIRSEVAVMWGTILLIILILLLLGAVPAWPHSRNWGYAPSGGLGLLLVIVAVLVLLKVI